MNVFVIGLKIGTKGDLVVIHNQERFKGNCNEHVAMIHNRASLLAIDKG